MGLNRFTIVLFFFLLLTFYESTSAAFISDDVFDSRDSSTGRNLLQAKKACSVNFEFLNYTIITSRCKGPSYPPDPCCGAFLEFSCPYSEQINDLTTDCASTMFSYINLYGHYPPGLFAHECRGDKQGLACPSLPPSSSKNSNSSSATQLMQHTPILLLIGFVIFLMELW